MKLSHVSAVLGAVVLAIGALVYANQSGFQWTKAHQVSHGPFFRVDVKLKYKGEPLDMSFEVTCSAHITTYADNSNSYDVGLTPNVYGRRMSDGQAVVVRPPDACHGETTDNGQVPKNFMPVIIVYEDANTMAFGKAYISDDAYNGPISELTFESATITASNQTNFETFRKDGPKNAVTREMWWSRQDENIDAEQGLKHFYPTFGEHCDFRSRFNVPDILKPILRASPSYRAGEYWSPTEQKEIMATFGQIFGQKKVNGVEVMVTTEKDPTPRLHNDYELSHPDLGVSRDSGKSWVSSTKFWTDYRSPSVYPMASNFASGKFPSDLSKWQEPLEKLKTQPGYYTDIKNGKYRGFVYCYSIPFPAGFDLEWMKKISTLRGFNVIDDERINTIPPVTENLIYSGSHNPIFFGDQFVLEFNKFVLSSMRGDI